MQNITLNEWLGQKLWQLPQFYDFTTVNNKLDSHPEPYSCGNLLQVIKNKTKGL